MKIIEQLLKKSRIYIYISIIAVLLVSIFKYRTGQIGYQNEDATWHVLLTMTAYDETPKSIHKFVPIVSLGKEDDKDIPWGATVKDDYGNYYYTSFSPAGFICPYLFVKIFHLPINETSLYIFNTVLFSISSVFWLLLIQKMFKENPNKNIIMFIAMLTYIFVPELFHGMGIVYWHQSILQVTLCMQLYFYYRYKYENNKKSYIIFLLLCLINPYMEWTGYVANIGFALAEFISNWKTNKKESLKKAFIIGVLTILSFLMFVTHYLLVISPASFFDALYKRFFARGIMNDNILLTDLFGGYLKSFLYIWLLLFIIILYLIIAKGKIEFHNKIMMLVMIFPIIENIIMKEHALSYTYDRMKLVFILSYLICDFSAQIISYDKSRKIKVMLVAITILFSLLNINSYIKNKNYIFEVNSKEDGQELANYINTNYEDSVLVTPGFVRGYFNLLYHRGVYEHCFIDTAQDLAKIKNKRYAIEIDENLTSCKVYDMVTGELKIVDKTESGIAESTI